VSAAHDRSAADLNAEDDEGRWWSLLRDAVDPARIEPGAVVAGTERFWSIVRIEQVDADGQATSSPCRRTIRLWSSARVLTRTVVGNRGRLPRSVPALRSAEWRRS
jgi:hypothetical protein